MTADAGQKTEIDRSIEGARHITAIHHEETGEPRYPIQVIFFYAVAPDSHYVIGRPAPANQIWTGRVPALGPVAQPRALGPLDEPKI